MKKIITTFLLFFFCLLSKAQIFGDNDVCAGNIYNYTATIAGAVTYQWTFPSGWYNISGQGTSSATATCNINAGDIYCEGIDAGGNSIATLVLVTQFGGGGAVGWDVQPQNSTTCMGDPYTLNIVPNGSGGESCPNGCGSGNPVINVGYAVYDNVWPFGNFVGFADGSGLSIPSWSGNFTYYIYYVDYTAGTNTSQAVRIEGGCGSATVNNIAQLNLVDVIGTGFIQTPDPVCIGDTVTLFEVLGFTNPSYSPVMGITILSQSGGSMTAVVNSMPARASYTGTDWNGCLLNNFIIYINVCAPSQLNGDTVVCAGYTYSYTATIAGAVTYNWSLPTGWYNISGQGTATITATCNVNAGWITVSGLDAGGNIIGVENVLTSFGGGGFTGWDVYPQTTNLCTGFPATLGIVPNGTGGGPGCPPGCGNGTLVPNLKYCVYDNIWPTGNWVAYADGFSIFFPTGGVFYVYLCDVSNGNNPPQAVRIEGGCGSATVNNIAIINNIFPSPPAIMQTPSPACVGDTIQITELTGFQSIGWGFFGGNNDLQLISSPNSNPLVAVVTGYNAYTDLMCIDFSGCPTGIPYIDIDLGICALPSVSFASSDTVFCDKQSIDFSDLSTNNPTSWQWYFPGAQPDTSTQQNPAGIYYPTSGAFDVTLIACNAVGCNTLVLSNFIIEYASPYDSIWQSNDTLYSLPAATYQWYEVGTGLISGATSQSYVPTQAGNYYCSITDSVGCAAVSNTISITTGIAPPSKVNFQISIIPNPGNGIFKLEINSTSKIRNLNAQILSAHGQVVYERDFTNVDGKFSDQINLSNKPKGIYMLKLMIDGKFLTRKVIVH